MPFYYKGDGPPNFGPTSFAMDLSISTSSLLGLCLTISGLIVTYVNKIRKGNADISIKLLGLEVNSYSKLLQDLHASFEDVGFTRIVLASQTGHEGAYW